MMATRPDPDELLRRVQAEERKQKRGRLTVFFGRLRAWGRPSRCCKKQDSCTRWSDVTSSRVLSRRTAVSRRRRCSPASRGSHDERCGEALGVLGVYGEDPRRFEDPEQQRLADAFATQLATSIERARFAEETERARVQVETEQLRSTLLSSVSHDLRTPLAVMQGAASTLVDDDEKLAKVARRDLASAILEEAERLDRQVRNLLDMTRLESGSVQVKKEWQSLQEVIGGAFSRVESRLGGRTVSIRVLADLVAPLDGRLIDQVVVNLLENASKYTPEGSPVDVTAIESNGEVLVEVADRGAGILSEEQERIFDKFHRGTSERTKGGVGLGLTICRAIIAAHGGRIWVENREGGGASFKFALPLDVVPEPAGSLPEIAEGTDA
ncbi:MAG TPA: ATP-binding protein [Labilithrix sp.]|nr:ATP-binding protein [Labilithrix sp.]